MVTNVPPQGMAIYKQNDGTYGFFDPNHGVVESNDMS